MPTINYFLKNDQMFSSSGPVSLIMKQFFKKLSNWQIKNFAIAAKIDQTSVSRFEIENNAFKAEQLFEKKF